MINIEINNGRTMEIHQNKTTKEIKVYTGKGNNIDSSFSISEGDFVLLMDYYRYQKENKLPW